MTTTSSPPDVNRGLIVLLASLSVFGPLSMDLYLPSLPDLAVDLETTDRLAQLTMSVCMIGLGLGQLVAGPVSDRFGRRPPMLIGVTGFAAMSFLAAFAPTIEVLLVARTFQGLAGSAGMVVAMAIARDLYAGPYLARTLAALSSVAMLAPVVGPVIGGQLTWVTDWRGVFVVLGGIGVVQVLAAAAWLPETRHPDHHDGPEPLRDAFRELLKDRLLLSVLGVQVFVSVAFFSYLSMSSFAFQNELRISPLGFSVLFAVNSVALMGGVQTTRALVLKWGPRRLYLAGLTMGSISAVLLAVSVYLGTRQLGIVIGGLALILFAMGVFQPNGPAMVLTRHGRRAGTAAALMGALGASVGPVLVPVISGDRVDLLQMVLWIAIGEVGAVLAAWLLVARVRN